MKTTFLRNLPIESKRTLIELLVNGTITKDEMNNNELEDIFKIGAENLICLRYINLWGKIEYNHNGEEITKEKFERLSLLYKKLFPNENKELHILEKGKY